MRRSPGMLLTAWGGALLFLASLGYFAWFYLVRLADPAPGPAAAALPAAVVNVALFSAFAVHHSVFARAGVKAWLARRLPHGLERSFYVWVASLLFLAVCRLWRPLPGTAWEAAGLARWLLYGLQLPGVALTLKSASRIDVWELAGVRQAQSARSAAVPSAQPALESNLEIDGPYRWVRHPIYFGWVLMVFGTPTLTASRLLFASVSTLYLMLAIPFEERSLTHEFGAAYTAYQQEVRWRLIPGVW